MINSILNRHSDKVFFQNFKTDTDLTTDPILSKKKSKTTLINRLNTNLLINKSLIQLRKTATNLTLQLIQLIITVFSILLQ